MKFKNEELFYDHLLKKKRYNTTDNSHDLLQNLALKRAIKLYHNKKYPVNVSQYLVRNKKKKIYDNEERLRRFLEVINFSNGMRIMPVVLRDFSHFTFSVIGGYNKLVEYTFGLRYWWAKQPLHYSKQSNII